MSVPAAIPLVTGRHRNRALAVARQARAVQLATEGRTYQEIVDELGYANRGTVHHIAANGAAPASASCYCDWTPAATSFTSLTVGNSGSGSGSAGTCCPRR